MELVIHSVLKAAALFLYVFEVKISRQRKKFKKCILVMCQVLHCQEMLCYMYWITQYCLSCM